MPITAPTASNLQLLLNQGWNFQQHIGDNPTGRIALCRVWHGYVVAAYRSGSSVKVRFFDPYKPFDSNWISSGNSGKTITLAGQTTASPVALAYVDVPPYLFAVLFTNLGEPNNNLGISWAQLPNIPDDPTQNWDLSSISFCGQRGDRAGVMYGPSVQPLDGCIAIAYGATPPTQSNAAILQAYQVYTYSDPNGAILSSPPAGQNRVVYNTTNSSTLGPIYTICEPTLILFNGNLYCYTVDPQNYIQVTQLSATQPSPVTTIPFETDVAPAVTVDPSGTIVILVYKQPGSKGQPLMYTSSTDGVTFAAAQNLKTGNQQQATQAAPTLLALKTGQIVLAFQSGTGNGTYSLCPSGLWMQPNGLNVIPASS
jgi:hypothetical protein